MRTLHVRVHRLLPILLLPGMFSIASAAPEQPDAARRVDDIFAPWNSVQSPGCAVGVAVDGLTVLARAFGMADLEHDVPNTPATVFEAGSVAKQFTAAAVQLLAMDGKLSLDDDVRRYVPEVPDYGETITLRQMMTHTSGLRDWGSVAGLSGWGRSERTHTHAHVLDIVSRQSALNFPPGREYSYSNTGYNLLAIVVSRVSGMPFSEFSKRRIFEPLGMRDTQWRDDYRRIVKARSTAYSANEDGGFAIDRPIEDVHGNGGLLTTIGDLLIWNRALTDGRLGGAEFLERMHTRGRLDNGREISYAAGLRIRPFEGVPSVTHTGSTSGYRAFLGRYPDQGLSIALLCNVSNANPGDLGERIASVYLDRDVAPDPRPAAGSGAGGRNLEALAGLYRDARTGEPLRLVVRDAGLGIDGEADLLPISETEFDVAGGERRFVFRKNPGPRPTILVFSEEYEEGRYEPVDEAAPTVAELAELEGTYASEDAEASLLLKVEEGQLAAWQRPGRRIPLQPVYRDVFDADGLGFVRFHRDAGERVVELGVIASRVYDMRFRRECPTGESCRPEAGPERRAAPAAAPETGGEEEPEVFTTMVVGVQRSRRSNLLYFEFENGEVWRQTQSGYIQYPSDRPFEVEIRKGVMGDRQLRVGGEGRMTRIVRVK